MAELSVSHRYAAAPETVFDAWLKPETARRFLFATPTGTMVRAEIDARVGGLFTFVDRRPGMGDVLHQGEYLEIDRPRRLVFTFTVPQFDAQGTTVELDFKPDGAGCEVTLTHRGVLPQWVERTEQGWGTILKALDGAL